ncbi:hypothetical protein AMST5_04243 [freshwater sediment metagenome]|uniref:Uncharacterized protein n=1 Tax=freshwater sediment metagenome TaxID=556182 RepID=A0AA48M4K5_9ZZZZ
MQYTQTALDRRTGDIETIAIGDWVTVTELGERYGVGRITVRTILQEMGLLQSEGIHGRCRLTREAVAQGLGKRHDKPKNGGYPFDVISPAGQALIADKWQEAVDGLEARRLMVPEVTEAKAAITGYMQHRECHKLTEMTPQMQVSWLLDHFEGIKVEQIALVIGVTRQLVERYAKTRKTQRDYFARSKASTIPLPRPSAVIVPGGREWDRAAEKFAA